GWIAQLLPRREIQQLIVGNAAPQEEREPRCELEIGHAIRRSGRCTFGIALDAEREERTRENAFEPALHSAIERTLLPPLLVHLENRLELRLRDWLPIGAAREVRQDLGRTRPFAPRLRSGHVAAFCGHALEDGAAAWRVAGSFRIERSGHGECLDM